MPRVDEIPKLGIPRGMSFGGTVSTLGNFVESHLYRCVIFLRSAPVGIVFGLGSLMPASKINQMSYYYKFISGHSLKSCV